MANTLTGLMKPLSVSASTVIEDLSLVQGLMGALTDQITPSVQQLLRLDGGVSDFSGMGAQAFQEAFKVHVDITGHLMDAFQGAAQAVQTFGETLDALDMQYDGALRTITAASFAPNDPANLYAAREMFANLHADTAMIDEVLSMADGGSVLHYGAENLLSLLSSVHAQLVVQAENAPVPLSSCDALSNPGEVRQMVVDSLDRLYDTVGWVYADWGDAVQQAFSTFQTAMTTVQQQVQPYCDLLTRPTSAVSLFDLIHEISGSSDPIAIVQTGPNSILVMVSGTELNNLQEDTNIWNALGTGMGQHMPYEQDVIAAIEQFNAEHGLKNPEITLAGHSLGGMVDQQIAEQERSLHFDVTQVITFGSPVMGDPVPGVKYDIYAAKWDPIPMLSRYEDPSLPGSLQQVAQEFPSIQTNYVSPGWNPFSSHFWGAIGRDTGATVDNIYAIRSGVLNLRPLLAGAVGKYLTMATNLKTSYMDPYHLYGPSIQIVPDLTTISPAVHSDYGQSTWLAGQDVISPPSATDFLSNVEYFGMPNEYQTAQIDQYMKTHSSLGQVVSLKFHS